MTLIYDLETDGLLDTVSKIHCAVIFDTETGKLDCYFDEKLEGETFETRERRWSGTLLEAAERLSKCSRRSGHNIYWYDEAVLRKFYPQLFPLDVFDDPAIRDTMVGLRVLYPDEHLKRLDQKRWAIDKSFPAKLIGRHSLEAWGYRIRCYKGNFKDTHDFKTFTLDMLEYCVRDVLVTSKLYRLITEKRKLSELAWTAEQAFAETLRLQQENGVRFDVEKAHELAKILEVERAGIREELIKGWPSFTEEYVTPAKKLKKTRVIPFNPGSRVHLGRMLIERYGWKPLAFGEDGHPSLDDSVLATLPYPEAAVARRLSLIDKRLGHLLTGKQSLIKSVKADGRIHGRVNHNFAVTSRCSHTSPNVNVPKVGKPYGAEFRSLFTVDLDNVLVGCDASGLELRMLAHFIAKYDGGEYAKVVVSGDPHSHHQRLGELPTRDAAKTFIYAYLYGAGDVKLGTVGAPSGVEWSEVKYRARGRALRKKFETNFPGLADLKKSIHAKLAKRSWLAGLDGRPLAVRSEHASLNTLLQGGGAVLMKHATVLANRELRSLAVPFKQVLHVHDEIQTETPVRFGEVVGKTAAWAITKAGEVLGLRCPMAGEWKVGRNWKETH